MQRLLTLFALPIILLGRNWTVMVYMAADNGLSPWADADLLEMKEVGSDEKVTILVQLDKPHIGAKRLYITKGSSYELGNLGIIDMCDYEVLADFLVWGITNFPADRFFVILWDHGTGWTMAPQRSFGSDWSSGNQLSISNGDFQKAIKRSFEYTGKKIALFAFDACLMQQIEVAYEIKDYAKIFLAAQTIWPASGFPYNTILQKLRAKPGINEIDLAKDVVEECQASYAGLQSIAISAIDLQKLKALKDAITKLLNNLLIGLPSQNIKEIRHQVQTIPISDHPPQVSDGYVDLGDLLKKLADELKTEEAKNLLERYNNTIVLSRYLGEEFVRTTGLTVWFPENYQEFKSLIGYYLGLDWSISLWCQFLNWFYNQDDLRPTDPLMLAIRCGDQNDLRLYWQKSFDLAQVFYTVCEMNDTNLIFEDACEDSTKWDFSGFELSKNYPHSGNYAFFSGDANNLFNTLTTKDPVLITELGLLNLHLNYNTEEMADSLIIEYGPFKDIHYGHSSGWINRRVILPPGSYHLKLTYRTNSSINRGGCYVDDIKIYNLKNGRFVQQHLEDTTLYIFNKLRGNYYYGVIAVDRYGNRSNLSNFQAASITNFARPYSNPNPFQTICEIVLDYPDSLLPSVFIFSCSGRLVKQFAASSIQNKKILWNGMDESNRQVGSGLYFIVVKDGPFTRIGKIARQR